MRRQRPKFQTVHDTANGISIECPENIPHIMIAHSLLSFMPHSFMKTAIQLRTSQTSIDYAFIYFLRCRQYISIEHSNYAVILGCLCVGDKFISDFPLKNITIAQNFNISLQYLNTLEMWICQLMHYHLIVASSEWYALQ